MIIIVDANIGAGKSTVIAKLSKKINAVPVLENTSCMADGFGQELLDFQKSLNRDNALKLQHKVIADKDRQFAQIQHHLAKHIIIERGYESIDIFNQLFLQQGYLTDTDYQELKALIDIKISQWAKDIYHFYLHCDPNICYQRLKDRNQNIDQSINNQSLIQLNDLHEQVFLSNNIKRTVVIDANDSIEIVINKCLYYV